MGQMLPCTKFRMSGSVSVAASHCVSALSKVMTSLNGNGPNFLRYAGKLCVASSVTKYWGTGRIAGLAGAPTPVSSL